MRAGAAASIALVVALALLPCWGCGSNEGTYVAPTVPVKGKVTYQGKSLIQGSVTFEPVDSGREAQGSIQPDGTFVLTTFKEGDGAVAGMHRVAVTGTSKGAKEAVPLKYQNPSSSKVEVEVSEGKSEYTIDLK
jgi:hypothetical protein